MALFLQKRNTQEVQALCSGTIRHKQPLDKTAKDTLKLSFRLAYDYIMDKHGKHIKQCITCIAYGWRAKYANHLENGDCVLITGKLKSWYEQSQDKLKVESYYVEITTIMAQPRSFDAPEKVRKRRAVKKQGYIIETDGDDLDNEFLPTRNVADDMDIFKNIDDGDDYPF